MALDLTIEVYKNDACTDLLIEDVTGLYSTPSNTGGYNSPNPAVANATDLVITLTYTQLAVDAVYTFTILSGVIQTATVTLGSATPVNIISFIDTTWPMTSANPFNLTDTTYGAGLPTFDDMVYEVSYVVTISAVEYTTTAQVLVDCATCCCISTKALNIDINDTDKLVASLIPYAFLQTAGYANDLGNTSDANTLLNKAADLCADTDCGSC